MDDKPISKEELEEFYKLIDEENLKEYEAVREMLRQKDPDMHKGFNHINFYSNKHNFDMGYLDALEATRKRIGIETSKLIIDHHYILGYAHKRILYILYQHGYRTINLRILENYIWKNKKRLDAEREKLMSGLKQATSNVFQEMKQEVMAAERKTLEIYLNTINILQEKMASLDPIEDAAEFNKLDKRVGLMQTRVNEMNGITGMRQVTIEVAKNKAISREKKKLDLGFYDNQLQREVEEESRLVGQDETPGLSNGNNGKVLEIE